MTHWKAKLVSVWPVNLGANGHSWVNQYHEEGLSECVDTDNRLLAGNGMATGVPKCVRERNYLFVWNTPCSFIETSLQQLRRSKFCLSYSRVHMATVCLASNRCSVPLQSCHSSCSRSTGPKIIPSSMRWPLLKNEMPSSLWISPGPGRIFLAWLVWLFRCRNHCHQHPGYIAGMEDVVQAIISANGHVSSKC